MTLRPATPSDFGFIRSLTTDAAYAPFIGDADEGQLARWLADPAVRVLIWGDQAGFAIFRELDAPSGAVELFRLALARTSGGQGRGFLAALTRFAFDTLGARRVWLDCSAENLRAQRVYEAAGFRLEGRLRQHWHRPALGRNVDLLLFGMMRDEAAA